MIALRTLRSARSLWTSLPLLALAVGTLFLWTGTAANAPVAVWTNHNDNQRTGANLNETQLTTSTVTGAQFGKLFSYVVDADVYAQPLVIPNVAIAGKGTHNVVYVATMNNSVYTFDADNNRGNNATPLWQVTFNNPAAGVTPVPADDVESSWNIRKPGPVGVMGTPVIDLATSTLYLVARTKETSGGTRYVQRLHALDIRNGIEKFGGPVEIQASVPGSGDGSVGGLLSFDPFTETQRPALALASGMVYVMWASFDDRGPYHGWVMAYDAATLNRIGVWCASPNGSEAGFWMSGQGASIDEFGSVYGISGNGTFSAHTGGKDYGESLVKLSPALDTVLDWFAPNNWAFLNGSDADFGSAGALLIPNTNYVIGGGKFGRFYLMDRSSLGHVQPGDTQIVQSFQVTNGGHIHGSPVYWNGPGGPLMYVMGENDYLKGFRFNGAQFNSTPDTMSSFPASEGMPGGFLSVSANGATAGSGVVWVNMPLSGDAVTAIVPGVLRAFDASNLSHELWHSQQNATQDSFGNFAKFVPPTVANGRVYQATFSYQLVVYGLLASLPPSTGGSLSASSALSSGTVNLTTVGTSDWARWPGYLRKATGGTQISDVTTLGWSPTTYPNDPRTITWTDGSNPVSGSSQAGIVVSGAGSSFVVSAPADTTTRTLTLYVGGWSSTGRITAHLTDGSAVDVTGSDLGDSGAQYDVVHTITYRAGSAGQHVQVQWTQSSSGGNIHLQAAALAATGGGTPPAVPTNVAASDGTSTTSVAVTWTAVSGATSYTVYRSPTAGVQGSAIGTPTTNAWVDTTATPGLVYYYGVTAANSGGTSALSGQNSGFVALSPPAVPTNVAASDGTSTTSVSVTWTAVSGATSYTVYRSPTAGVQGSLIGTPTTNAWVDTTATPGVVYYYGVTASSSAGTSALSVQNSGFAAAPSGGGAGLSGLVLPPATAVNLTTVGTSDWARWPGSDHKATGGSQLPTYTLIGTTGAMGYGDAPRTLSWTDGTPTPTGSVTSGLYVAGIGNGFQLTAPADLTTRTLTVYLGGWISTGQLTATLSDGSAPAFVGAPVSGSGQYSVAYQLTYTAAGPGRTLTLRWIQTAGPGNVTLQGAALAAGGGTPPAVPTNVAASDGTSTTSVAVTWTAVSGATSYTVYRSPTAGVQGSAIGTPTTNAWVDTTATPGLVYYYGVTAANSGGTSALSGQNSGFVALSPPAVPTNVAASDGTSTTSVSVTWTAVSGATSYTVYRSPTAGVQGSLIGTPTTNAWVDTTATPGVVYYYGVTASSSAGTSALSVQNSGFAAAPSGGGAGLSGLVLPPATAVNLTTVGTSDWARWPGSDHKATGGSQLPTYTLIGTTGAMGYGDAPRTLSWTDGTPTPTGSVTSGLYVAGIGNGFQLTAPADLTTRTLTVYLGGWISTGQLTATLSDGSAPAFVGAPVSGSGQYSVAYQLTYTAAGPGRTLTLRWIQTAGPGNVTLQGAALAAGGGTPPAVPTNVAASDGTSTTSVAVTWTAVSGATSYTVYRSPTAGVQGSAIGTPTTNAWVDTTATPGLVYYYGVTAANSGGTSALSGQNSGFVALSPPAVPTNVAASDGTSTTSVSVTWTAVSGATSYTVYRSPTAGVQGSLIGTPTTNAWVDTTATPGVVYYYGVTASSSAGTSALSVQNSGFAAAPSGGGAGLSGLVLPPATAVNLTTVGTSDWARWPGSDHKATGGSQLPTYTLIGTTGAMGYGDAPRTLSWTDGTPTPTGSVTSGLYVAGIGNGFQLTAPADLTTRTLTVYLGGWISTGQLTATLSDGSAPAFVGAPVSGSGQYSVAYQLTYTAAGPGRTLTLRWIQTAGPGNVTLQAAALK